MVKNNYAGIGEKHLCHQAVEQTIKPDVLGMNSGSTICFVNTRKLLHLFLPKYLHLKKNSIISLGYYED